ncbi:VIT-domain-containing protein [Choiromyces venosus 120613-1]|uniref:VIT-domain-containing protein n=1 Tax=Choiromyces venosus 120613-1 TaxID=1336337 RepID=A0A3N4JKA8_9PEZI|nr:VIT-domain-containing protein [Choiromyces venosus 120613-1]
MTTRVTYVDHGYQQSLPLVSTTLKSHIVDLTASHTLTQVYNNSSDRDISEAQYTFPLYESCAVTDFQALVGEKTIRGVVKEKTEAKAIYQAAKSAGKVAALFSQDTSEVFTTSVGNIPAGNSVVVVIKYVHELKQDIEVDGVKLVIPTVIAPKYGAAPSTMTTGLVYSNRWRTCWNIFSREIRDIGNVDDAGLSISITATMSGPIRGITSPSHPISVGLGSHSSADDADFNPKKAHATLALASSSLTGLDKDFNLLINANNIGDPRAFLAPHPTLKDTSALMVTMVPKFALPPQGHEIIFVVDRSGSMNHKIVTVRSALQLFLASLPVGSYFNICSFGSVHSFLWPQSQRYSEESLTVAKTHVMGLDSSLGGTEILAPVISTMKTRRQDMRTEVLILTDGEVWNTESIFQFINESSKDGNVRFFSLGVGSAVSHSLVEGISRAGRGYSQIVSTTSNLQKKVMRMLKAALTPHVNDWDVVWAGKPEKQGATLITSAPTTIAPISLFDPNCDPDNIHVIPTSSTPTLTLPKVIQAPTIIPALFPYSRTTVYFLISNGDRPERVFLKGSAHDTSSNTICPLQIEIPVQMITSTGASLGLYQLAGRKLLQDLEEGRLSYLEGIYDKTKEPTKHAELIVKEGTRVGVEFGLASKWTSFVAIAEDESTGEEQVIQQPKDSTDVPMAVETQIGVFGAFASQAPSSQQRKRTGSTNRISTGISPQQQQQAQQVQQVQQMQQQAQQMQQQALQREQAPQPVQQLQHVQCNQNPLVSPLVQQRMQRTQTQVATGLYAAGPSSFGSSQAPGPSPTTSFGPLQSSSAHHQLSTPMFGSFQADTVPSLGYSPTSPSYSPASPTWNSGSDALLNNFDFDSFFATSEASPLPPPPPAPRIGGASRNRATCKQTAAQSEPSNLIAGLAAFQQFNGMFKAEGRIFTWLGLRNSGLESAHADPDLVATLVVIIALEKKYLGLAEEWEFMVAKAREAIMQLYSEEDRRAVAAVVAAALGVSI